MGGIVYELLHAVRHQYLHIGFCIALCTGLEYFWPRGPYSFASLWRSAAIWLFNGAAIAVFVRLFVKGLDALHIHPLLTVPLAMSDAATGYPLRVAWWIGASLVSFIIADFFYYWMHFASHRIGLLWRFHRPHHAVRDLNVYNGSAHVGEWLLTIPCVSLPMAILVHPDVGHVPSIITTLMVLQNYFNHSATRVNLGPLRYVISDNRFHRLHHATDRYHQDSNYGAFTTIWDQLFGTAHFPEKDQWPETGLKEYELETRFWDHLLEPFKSARRSRTAPVATAIVPRPRSEAIL